MKLKPKKCSLFKTEVLFLGYKISRDGIHTDPAKIQAVKEFPRPIDVQGVRRFLGLTNYYRKFIEDYAKIAFPLNRLLDKGEKRRKNPPVDWTPECETAFELLKSKLISAPILSLPREEGEYILDTDSSAEGLGGVLSQMQDEKLSVIAYSSKALSKAERNYCVSRQELLAIVYHVLHWRCYLWGNHFTVRTDHASLRYLISFKDATGQLARWIDALSEYDFEIQARPGRRNGNADSLSRIPCGGKRCMCNYECSDPTQEEFEDYPCPLRSSQDENALEEVSCEDVSLETVYVCRLVDTSEEADVPETQPKQVEKFPFPWTTESIQSAQREDPVVGPVVEWLEKGVKPMWQDVSHLSREVKSFLGSWKNLSLKDGILFRRNIDQIQGSSYQLVMPTVYQTRLLHQYHDTITGGHLGVGKTYSRIQARYFWPDMFRSVVLYVRTCVACQRKKSPPKSYCAPLQKYMIGVPFERIAMDVTGPLNETTSGNCYILVVSDLFSRWVECYAMPDQTATTIANLLAREWISRLGCPSEILSDQGTQFESKLFQALCDLLHIDKSRTVVRRPQSDGMVERWNRTLKQMLSTVVHDNAWEWDELLPFVSMAFRSCKSKATGFTPNFLIFGREVTLPVEAFAPSTPDEQGFESIPEYVLHVKEMLQKSHSAAMVHLQRAVEYQERSYLNRLKPHAYKLKDAVWYWRPVFKKGQKPKLLSFWVGPYFIVEILSDVVYRVQKSARTASLVVHHNHLKPCYFREQQDIGWLDGCIARYAERRARATPNVQTATMEPRQQAPERARRERRPPDRYDNRIPDPELALL